MKDVNQIKNLKIISRGIDGGNGWLKIPHVKKDGTKTNKIASVVYSVGGGWEHVSIALINQNTPTWEDMCWVKSQFWDDEETVMQLHPKKSEYVNNKENCLHLWRPLNCEIPTPPKIFV